MPYPQTPLILALIGSLIVGTAAAAERKVTDADRKHWAFQKLTRAAVPPVKDASRARTPVDAFLLAKLEAADLTFAPDADRHVLVRRAFLDLLGLPPSPEEVEAFVSDGRPDAYERLLDRLLASPHFGERWGRHWLDGAGYVDVTGGDNDAGAIKLGENKWRYRDYVIRAFNDDKRFDRFLTEQIAGDELVDWRSAKTFDERTRELLIATGFLRTAADDTDENELNTLDIRHGVLQRTAEVLASNILGLTLNCAKCHEHKFEPIRQRDYYQVLALLQPALNPDNWLQPKQRQLPDLAPAEKAALDRHNADIDRQVSEQQKRIAEVRRGGEQRVIDARLAALPEPIRADTKVALDTPPEKRNEVQMYLASKFASLLKVKPEEVSAVLNEKEKAECEAAERRVAELQRQRRGWGHLQVVYDAGPPTPTYLLRRGNHLHPGAEVPPGFLSVLCPTDEASVLGPTKAEGKTSRRRLALARWLTDVNTPAGALVLRVRVNRVWSHLFGKGLVETCDNFGVTGAKPSHPELLDWLASELVANGQHLKPLLKLLMTSTAYRQASAGNPQPADPDNRLLWRQRLRRLESECVRDAVLAVGGRLDRSAGGPPVPVDPNPDGSFVARQERRRSVYLLARRNYHPTLLGVFDQPVLTSNCACRTPSAVVLQSLTMLNDRFVLEQAEQLAGRVARAAGSAPQKQVEALFGIVLSRPPRPQETAWCCELLRHQTDYYLSRKQPPEQAARAALAQLCHTLLNTSEFLYVP